MHHFKITYRPKQTIVFDTSALDELSKESWRSVLTDEARANSYARKWLKEANVNEDNYTISVWESEELIPDSKQQVMIDYIIEQYNDIYVDKDEWGRKVRKYNDKVEFTAILSDISFLRLYFPEFTFQNRNSAKWICNFNKATNWGDLKMPHI